MVDEAQRQRATFPSLNLGAIGAGAYGGRKTPSEIRQESINWGQEAGLGNRISFAGERGRDILNPNEMRVNAPSVEGWKQRAQRKMWMDRMYQQPDNPYYGQDQNWGSSAGITNPNLNGYKVMNASDPTGNDGWIDRLGRWLFNDPYDKESDESLYQGTEQDKLESEYGTEGTGEFYPDKIIRDLYPQAFGGQETYTTDEELNNLFEGLDSEDLGMEPHLEAQSQWKRPENMEKTIKSLEIRPEFEGWTHDEIKYWLINQARANRGGIIGLNGGGTIHKDSKTPLPDDLRDQMYDWILQQMMKQREEEMREQWERDRNPMLYPPPIPEGGMEV